MIIYKTTNLITGKIYIGQDSYNNPNYIGGGVCIKQAIRKYGKDNFRKDILEYCISKEHLNEREIYWIACFNSTNKTIGYNLVNGGNGCLGYKHTKEAKEKTGKANKGNKYHLGYKHSDETKRKISKINKGVTRTDEWKKHQSEIHKGIKHTEETKRKISEKHKGRVFSDEHKKNLSDKLKETFKNGRIHWNYGKHLSEETRKKISESKKKLIKVTK